MPVAAIRSPIGAPAGPAACSAAHSAASGPSWACSGRSVFAVLGRFWGRLGGSWPGPAGWPGGVPCGVRGDLVIVDQVRPVPLRAGVLGIGQQECSGLGEHVGVPAGVDCALAQYQVGVSAFPDAQADAHVHLGTDGVLSHGFLGRPLRCGDQVDRDGPAATGDRVGAVMGFVRQFRVSRLSQFLVIKPPLRPRLR